MCVSSYYPQELEIIVASDGRDLSSGQRINADIIIFHNNFNEYSYGYNIALIKTAQKIKLGRNARPIKLSKSTPAAGTVAEITGFGETYVSSQLLHFVAFNSRHFYNKQILHKMA